MATREIVGNSWVPKWEARERRGPASGSRAMPAGGGILLAATVSLVLWLLVIVATVSLVG